MADGADTRTRDAITACSLRLYHRLRRRRVQRGVSPRPRRLLELGIKSFSKLVFTAFVIDKPFASHANAKLCQLVVGET